MSLKIPDRIQEIFKKPAGARDRNDLKVVQNWIAEDDQLRELFSYAQLYLSRCKESSLAEDVVHDFFKESLNSVISDFRPEKFEGDFWGYLILCLKRFCQRKSTNLHKERNRFISFSNHAAAEKYALETLPDDSARLPDHEFFLKEIRTSIKNFLDELDSKYRSVFEKCYFEEKSIKEIAKDLGTSEANAKIRLFRVRRQIKKSLPMLALYLQD